MSASRKRDDLRNVVDARAARHPDTRAMSHPTADEIRRARRIPIIAALFLSACANTSGVVPLGKDTFMISRSEKGLSTTGSRVKADAIKEANARCAADGRQFELVSSKESDMVPFKSDAQAEIEFRCR